jgi:hypothetical protein
MSNDELHSTFYPREYRTNKGPLACPSNCDYCGCIATEADPITITGPNEGYLHHTCRSKLAAIAQETQGEKATGGMIELTPDYSNLLRSFAYQITQHSFAYGSVHPIISVIEMARYIDRTNPDELEEILVELRQHAKKVN